MAQGFSQINGIDYNDTYAPVACLASSHAIIAMANCLHLELQQVDIKGAYLNSVLNEGEVLYMWHLPGYKSHDTGCYTSLWHFTNRYWFGCFAKDQLVLFQASLSTCRV